MAAIQLNSKEYKGIFINALYTVGSNMSGLFTSLFVMNYANSYIILCLYLISRYCVYPLFFLVGGKLSRKVSSSTVIASGLILTVASLVMLVVIQNDIAQNPYLVYLFGVLLGSGEGLFWFAINVMNQDITTKESRNGYLSLMGILNSIANIIAPLLSAIILSFAKIDLDGFIFIFEMVAVLYIILIVLSFTIKSKPKSQPFRLLPLFRIGQDKQWDYIKNTNLLHGIRESFFLGISSVVIYQHLDLNGTLMSNINVILAIVCILGYYLAAKVIKRHNRILFFRLGGIAVAISILILGFTQSTQGVYVYGILYSFAIPFYANPFSIIKMNILSDYHGQENIAGHIIVLETVLGIGRMIGFALVIGLAVLLTDQQMIQGAAIIYALVMLIIIIYVHNYHQRRDNSISIATK